MALKGRDLLFILSTAVLLLMPGYSAVAAPGDITTVAGGAIGDGGPATDAFMSPNAVAMDSFGNIFIADAGRVRKINAESGIITTIAGNGECAFSGDDGPSIASRLCIIQDIAVDPSGNIFIADVVNNRIRKIDVSTGIITTVAGNGHTGFEGDGVSATATSISYPSGVFVDDAGNIFISDRYNMRIRKVDTGGIISTVAGNGLNGFGGDGGLATNARFSYPSRVTVDSAGNIYVADEMNHRIRKITAVTGIITTIAGDGNARFSGDGGSALSASLNRPTGVSVDNAGNVYIADFSNSRIRKVSSGVITTIAGNGTYGFSGDGGLATNAGLHWAYTVFVQPSGDILVSDSGNGRIRKVDSNTGLMSTIAGKGWSGFAGDGGPATSASLYNPAGIALNASNDIYIADSANHRIRKVAHSSQMISTVVGNGTGAFAGDNGPTLSASLNSPTDVFLDGSGNMFIADTQNNRIRKVMAATGAISTVAGNGTQGFGGDYGPAVSASLNQPEGVFVDSFGNIYIADTWNHRVRKVNASTGIITTVAGNGSAGYAGDSGPAVSASLFVPHGLVVDAEGNLYIADTYNNRVRMVDASTGTITTVAGNGGSDCSGDGDLATNTALFQPAAVTLDVAGNLYVAEWDHRVRKIDHGAGIIVTIAGKCFDGFGGDGGDGGPATEANLSYPSHVSIDHDGNIFIADRNSNRIRRVEAIPDNIPDRFTFTDLIGVAMNMQFTSNSVMISGLTVSVPVSISGGGYSINGGPFTTTTGSVNNGDTVRVRQTSSIYYSTTTDALLTIGGVSDMFSVTTLADATPDPFTFSDQTSVPLNTITISNFVSVTGITSSVLISITSGEYELNASGVWTSANGSVNNNDLVRVRRMSSSSPAITTDTVLTIGGVSDTFSVTTGSGLICAEPVSPSQNWQDMGTGVNDLGEVVWAENISGNHQIISSVRGQLTSDANDHVNPSVNNRGDVVWEQNSNIYGNLSGQLTQLTFMGYASWPSINDKQEVVWSQMNGTYRQIYSNQRGWLTSDPMDHWDPAINNAGDVVWSQNGNIYGLIGGQVQQFTLNGNTWSPSISNTGEVVWSAWNGSGSRIYSNLRGQLTFDGCPGGANHESPSVNSCGDLTFMVWNAGSQVYRLGNNAPCVADAGTNDTQSQATAVSGNSTTTGMVQEPGDVVDWYKFTANVGDRITVTVNWGPTSPPNGLDVSLVDGSGMVLIPGPIGTTPMILNHTANYSGDYFVRLTALPGSRFGYNLSVKVVDVTPPTVSINPVTTPTNANIQTIVGNRESDAVIMVSVNTAASVGSVTYPTTTSWNCPIAALVEGANIITVIATDAASNSATASTSISYDSIAPTMSINSVATPTNVNTQTITGNREADAVITVSVNTAASVGLVTYSSATSWSCPITGLVEGGNIVTATATDAASNSAAVSASITYDSIAPTVSVNPVTTPTNMNSQTITGNRETDAVVAVSVNTTASAGSVLYPTATTWSCAISQLTEGTNTIIVTATDAAGNSATASASITYDSIAPMVSINPVTAPTNVNNQTISGARDADAVVVVAVNTNATAGPVTYLTGTTWSCAITSLVEGANAITVTATDTASNSASAAASILYDSIAPVVTIASPVTGVTGSNAPLLTYAVSDGTAVVKVDNIVVNTVSNGALDPLTDGTHTVRIEATDAANNTGYAQVTFTIDTIPPVVVISSPFSGATINNKQLLNYTVRVCALIT